MRAVLDPCDAEGRAGQQLFPLRVVLQHGQRGLARVREHKIRVFPGVDPNDAPCVVDQVPVRGCKLLHGVTAGVEAGEVDPAVRPGHVFLRECAADQRNAKAGVGKRGHRLTVQLRQADAGFHIVQKDKRVILRSGLQLDLLRGGVYDVGAGRCDLPHKVCAGGQVVKQDFAAYAGGVFPDKLRIAVHGKGDAGQGLHGLRVKLLDAQHRQGAVGDGDARIVGRRGVVVVHIYAMLRAVQDVARRGDDLLDGVIAGRNVRDIGEAVVVGRNAGNKLPVLIYLKGRAGQRSEVVRIALVDDQRGLADIAEGQRHVVSARPVDRLRRAIQLIARGRGNLIDLVAAHGKLVGIHLNDARRIGRAGGVVISVDLLKGDDRAGEGVARLLVHFLDGEAFLRGVLHGDIVHTRRLDADIDGIDDGVTCRGRGFGQRVGVIRVKQMPFDDALVVGRSRSAAPVRAGKRERRARKGLSAAVHLAYL